MERRKFIRRVGTGIGVFGLGRAGAEELIPVSLSSNRIKPRGLKKGDRVMMIAPASSPGQEGIDEAILSITNLGYQVVESPHLRKENGFLAGTDEERLADFHAAWMDETIQGIWCVRGGYGTTRLLPDIDWGIVRQNPKVFIGYSDITALHNAIFLKTGLVTFHGPVGTSEYTDYTKQHLRIITEQADQEAVIRSSSENASMGVLDPVFRLSTLQKGEAIGMLVGGNLTLLASMCGTGYLPSFAGKIVFIEDIGENPYRIDRMLNQLLQATDLDKAAAIIHGVYKGCGQDDPEKQTLLEVMEQTLGDLDVPQAYGFSFGHIDDQFTLPIGVYARVDTESGILKLLEKGIRL